ncbi:MAG TPA: hypothetical protein VH375_03345 [Rhodanobacteraceae bacterium]|jgi:hypothetical protein
MEGAGQVTDDESAAAIAQAPPGQATDWQAIFTWTLIPLTVAVGFIYTGLADPADIDEWAEGLLALIPLEYFRAFVVAIQSETYRDYKSPLQAVRSFLLSLAILIVIAGALSVYILKGDWWAWISRPDVYHAIAFALAVIAVDGVIGVYFFRGDAKRLAARLQAVADDARDWLQLGAVQLPVVLALLYGALLIAHETGHAAWVPYPNSEAMRSAGFLYAGFYFFGKAMLLAHAHVAEFNRTGERLFGAAWIQLLIWEKNKNMEITMHNERAAARRRAAILAGRDPDAD